jgi:ABC-type transport system involved in multi-copper enzyme maturation permease subunit
MSDSRTVAHRGVAPSGSGLPTWWIVFSRELRDLWVGGKALTLILLYSVLLGIYSYMLAANAEVNLLPLREMILEMVKASIAVGMFICLIIAADGFSGERERATLETVLLTPASRRQIAVGKFLSAISLWPVALAIAIPYWAVLSKGDPVFGQAVVWGTVLGCILAPAVAALGMLVSVWCNSNKTSMLVSICLFLLLLLPTELSRPGRVETPAEVRKALLYSLVNPWDAASKFLGKILINRSPLGEVWVLPLLSVVFGAIVFVLLFGVASRRLRLDAGMAMKLRSVWERWHGAGRAQAPRPAARGRAERTEPAVRLPEVARPISRPSRRIASRPEPAGPVAPTWWVVFKKELGDLWIGGRALHLTVAYTIVLGVYTYITARDSTLSLVPPKEMVYELTKAAMVASVFVGLIIGADSLSGERERATLEGLLLTPTSRLQIVVGKFLAASSPGPASLAITIPYMRLLSQGDEVFGQAVLWGAGLGCVLTLAFTAMAMFVGFWCNSNKTSLFVSLCLYLLFLLPTQLPGHAQGGIMGLFGQWVNPLAAPRYFLASLLVNNWTLDRAWSWLVSPVAFAVLCFGLLFWYASPGLRLEAGKARRLHWSRAITAAGLLIAALVVFGAAPAMALRQGASQAAAPSAASQAPVQVTIDVQSKAVKAGTPIEYHTVVTNTGTEASPPLIAAMNIINLMKQGDVVDPEDWSPLRTQYMDHLAPGQSDTLSWRINAILDGDYMVYMVVIPAPTGPEATTHPVTSPGIHLTVSKYTRLNPGGVLPYAIGGPVLLGLIIFFVYRHRHRQIDAGGAA